MVAILSLFVLAEIHLILAPPKEILRFLGDAGNVSGIYRNDVVYGVNYRDDEAFRAEYRERHMELQPLLEGKNSLPVWAFFGNSFVHAQGMLADTLRTRIKTRKIFNLGKNTPLPIRFAEIELLLRLGLKPDRIIISFMPIDILRIGRFPLDTITVNLNGSLGNRPRVPPGFAGEVVLNSMFLLTSWVRAKRHRGNPNFSLRSARAKLEQPLTGDILHLFSSLSAVAGRSDVPVTVLLIPDDRQILRGEPFGFQDKLTPMLRELGFDVHDPRHDFLEHERRSELFLPDKHYSAIGNNILSNSLLRHIDINNQ